MSRRAVCKMRGAPLTTFREYSLDDKLKRKPIETTHGRSPIFDKKISDFLCQMVIWKDRANQGMIPDEVIAHMQRLNPLLTLEQCTNHFRRTFKKRHKGILKTRVVKAQKTSLRRSQITVEQQYW